MAPVTKRVRLGGGGNSPMRISVAGVDADNAEFNNLIFDANQPPLRLAQYTWVSVLGISWDDWFAGQNTREGLAGVVVSSPLGTTPIFFATITSQNNNLMQTAYHNNSVNNGAGASITQQSGVNYAIGTAHNIGPPATPTVTPAGYYINFAIMRNWE